MLGCTLDATASRRIAHDDELQKPKHIVGLIFVLFRSTFSQERGLILDDAHFCLSDFLKWLFGSHIEI